MSFVSALIWGSEEIEPVIDLNPDLCDTLKAAAATSHNLDIAMERWGMAGVNYIANLIQSGHAVEAALIVSLPSYANAVIVAEEEMRNVALNQDAVFAQSSAAEQDMQDPYLNKNTTQRASKQALAALQSELIDSGALGDHSSLEQKVSNAQWILDDSKADLNHALQEEKAAKNTLAQAQACFYANMADTNATNAALAAIDSVMEASYGRKKAEQAFASNKRALGDSLQQLDAARQKDMANVQAQAKQRLAELKQQQAEIRAGLNEQDGGQTEELGTMQPDPLPPENVSNEGKEGNPLAPENERVIIEKGSRKVEMPEPPKPASLSDIETRRWYLDAEARIPDLIDKTKPLEQQAKQAFELRNMFRTEARAAMSSRMSAQSLEITDPNRIWEQIVEKYVGKGFAGDALYEEIIKVSTRSRTAINQSLGIFPK